MLKIRKTAIAFDEQELLELERIETDQDTEGALRFLDKTVYKKLELSQRAQCGTKLEKDDKNPAKAGAYQRAK